MRDADPDLGAAPDARARAEADTVLVDTQARRVGAGRVARMPAASGAHLGLLLLDGVISREVALPTRSASNCSARAT